MISAALAILAALIPFLVWLWRRRDAKQDDPKTENAKRYEQIDQDIAKGDSNTATLHSSSALDELDRLQNSGADRSSGPTGNPP
jgi:hypothetical protein